MARSWFLNPFVCTCLYIIYKIFYFCYSGESLKRSAGFLSSAAVVGLLSEGPQNGPNLVNALPLAADTGITVRQLNKTFSFLSYSVFYVDALAPSRWFIFPAALLNCPCVKNPQVKTDHDGSKDREACVVEVSVNGRRYKAVGSVQTGVPVLLELNGSVFRQPVPLSGHLLFFKAATSSKLLLSVTGKS